VYYLTVWCWAKVQSVSNFMTITEVTNLR